MYTMLFEFWCYVIVVCCGFCLWLIVWFICGFEYLLAGFGCWFLGFTLLGCGTVWLVCLIVILGVGFMGRLWECVCLLLCLWLVDCLG